MAGEQQFLAKVTDTITTVGTGRRNTLSSRSTMLVGVVSVVGGIAAALCGLHPTGSPTIDAVLVFAAAAAVIWASATAPWWVLVAAAGVAAAFADGWMWVVLGVCAAGAGAYIGARKLNLGEVRGVIGLAVVLVCAHLRHGAFQGLSGLIGVTVLAAVFVAGVVRRPRAVRRKTWLVVGGVCLVGGVGIGAMAVAALSARAPLQQGSRQARAALDALNKGNLTDAAEKFKVASASFRNADDDLDAWWTQPARLVPVLAQYRNAGSVLADGAASSLSTVAASLGQVDPQTVRMQNGVIDIASVRALAAPLSDVATAIDALPDAIAEARSPWLVKPVTRRLDDLDKQIANNRTKLANAQEAVRLAPQMLGATGVRRYLIAFLTPAEARGLGGFMGNFAEVTIDNGKVSVSRFGRHNELSAGGPDPEARHISRPSAVIDHWAGFGFSEPDGTTSGDVWANVTMPPDFPSTADVIAQLYPQSGGQRLDGVFAMMPEAVAALMRYSGPVDVPGVDQPITADNVVDFILKGQYEIVQKDERLDVLDTIARTTFRKLLAGALPEPATVGRDFAPLAAKGEFMAWSADAEEEQLYTTVRMAGGFPALNGGDGIAVTVDNAGANKLDAYLKMDVHYDATKDLENGTTSSVATITLTNTVRPDGLPDYVTYNPYGLPKGTNRAYVSVYTGMPFVAASVEGVPQQPVVGDVFGWHLTNLWVDVPPGSTKTLTVTVAGMLNAPTYTVVKKVQALPIAPTYELSHK